MSSSLSASKAANEETETAASPQVMVVFGRPGAGKTTVANRVVEKLLANTGNDDNDVATRPAPATTTTQKSQTVVGLDLDVCVPQWMKDNFSQGIYPTLRQRQDFMKDACAYVQEQMDSRADTMGGGTYLVSFSFVNTDLRDGFREAFPYAQWALIDTTPEEAQVRIEQREGHFYKGAPPAAAAAEGVTETNDTETPSEDVQDNPEWQFAPVDFEHICLPGNDSVDANADRVIAALQNDTSV